MTQVDGTTPITDAWVCLETFDGSVGYGCLPVDPVTATYTVTDLPAGQYRVEASAPGRENELFPETPFYNLAQPVVVSPPDDTPNTNFTLDLGAAITGTITLSDDGFQNGMFMCVNDYATGNHVRCRMGDVINPDGTFAFGHLPTGSYRVSVFNNGYPEETYNGVYVSDQATAIVVNAPTDTTGIHFVLEPGGVISGVVTQTNGSTPILTATICIEEYATGYGFGCRPVDPVDGTYYFDRLPTGTYRVRADAPGFINESYLEQPFHHLATAVTVTAPATVGNVNFTLDVGGSISGVVTRTDGTTPVTDAAVCVTDISGSAGYGCVGVDPVDATYTFADLPTGSFRVDASAPNRELEYYPETSYWNQAHGVLVTAPGNTPDINFTLGAGGSIQGTISLSDLAPLVNATICVNEFDTDSHVRCTGDINPDGTYSFDHLPSGSYRINAYTNGYIAEYYNGAVNFSDASPVTVTAPGVITGIDFILDPAARISGVVTEADGSTVIPNAQICAEAYQGGMWFGCTGVNPADGSYTLSSLPTGSFRLHAFAPGFAYEYYNNVPYGSQAQEVFATAPNETSGINFTLGPGGGISGSITTADAGDLASSNPSICVNEFTTNELITCRGSDAFNFATGEFTFDSLASGSYRVSVNAVGYRNTFYASTGSTTDWSAAGPVFVTASNNTSGIDVVLQAGGTISGTVRDSETNQPLGNIPVDLAGGGYGRCTNPDGTYTLESLPLDTPLKVQAGGMGWPECPGDDHMRLYWNGKSNESDADTITLTLGPDQFETGIDFVLETGGTVTGVVTEADGTTPIPDAWVCIQVHIWGDGYGCHNVDPADGTYSITGLPNGTFRMDAHAPGRVSELYQEIPWFSDHGQADPVVVTLGAVTPNINFTLAPDGSISGTIYESDGVTPLGGVPVGINWGGIQDCSDPITGAYTLSGLPLDTDIHVYAGGGVDDWWASQGCDDGFVETWYDGKPAQWVADPVVLVTGVSEDTTGIDFSMAVAGSVSGVVTEEDGVTPVTNAQVCIQQHPWGNGYGCRNVDPANGSYIFNGLPPGNYRVEAQASGFVTELYNNKPYYSDHSQSDPVVVTAGADTSGINFTLGTAGSISGVIYASDGVTPLGNIMVSLYYGGYEVCSDPVTGAYTITGIPLDMDIFVVAGGDVPPWMSWTGCVGGYIREWYDNKLFDWEADPVVLQSGVSEHTSGINFALEPAGAIAGVVTQSDGTTPITNATVCVANADDTYGYGCISVDPGNGSYVFGGLGTGDYRIEAFAPGFENEFYNNTPFYNLADLVHVTAPASTAGINFLLAPAGTISGTLTTVDSGLLVNATVCVNDYATDNHVRCRGLNGDIGTGGGSFTFMNLPAGTYRVSAWADGYAYEHYDGTLIFELAAPVVVVAGADTPDIDIELSLPLPTPSDLSGLASSKTRIDLQWNDNAADETGYSVERHDGVSAWVEIGTTAADFTTYADTGLECGTTYTYRVRTVRGAEKSEATDGIFVETQSCSPVALISPPNETVTRNRTPTFVWSELTEAQNYRFQLDNDLDFSSPLIETTTGTTASFKPESNLPLDTLFWRVQMRAGGVWGDYTAPWSITIDRTPPIAPTLTEPIDGAELAVLPVFDWDDVVDAAEYQIQVSKVATFSTLVLNEVVTESTFTPVSLDDGLYYWRVQAIDAANNKSPWSTVFSFRLDAIPAVAPDLVAPVDAFITKDKQVTFTWLAATDARRYRLHVSATVDFAILLVNETTGALTRTPLYKFPSGTYFWRVYTQGSDNLWSDASLVRTFSIDRTAPIAPTLLSPANKTVVMTLTPTFDWADNPESDLASYIIQIDNNKTFSSPLLTQTVIPSTFTPLSPLAASKVFWRVRGVDAVGNKSGWSPAWKLEMTVLKALPVPDGFRGN